MEFNVDPIEPQTPSFSPQEAAEIATGLRTAEEIIAQRSANEPPVDTPPVDTPPVNDPPVDTPPTDEPPVDTPPTNNPPVDTPPVGGIDLTHLGITTKEEIEAQLEELRQLKAQKEDIQLYKELKDVIEDPFKGDTQLAKMVKIKNDLGVSVQLASQIADLTAEKMQSNPLLALAYRDIIKNPQITSSMTLEEIVEVHAARLGVDANDPSTFTSATVKYESTLATAELTRELEKFKDVTPTPLKKIQEERTLQAQQREQLISKWNTVYDGSVRSIKTVEKDFAGTKVSVAVSPEDLQRVKEDAVSFALSQPEPTPESITAYVQGRLAIEKEQLLSQAYAVKLKEEMLKSSHNGGAVTRPVKPDSTADEDDPDLIAQREAYRAAGINVDGFSVKKKK